MSVQIKGEIVLSVHNDKVHEAAKELDNLFAAWRNKWLTGSRDPGGGNQFSSIADGSRIEVVRER